MRILLIGATGLVGGLLAQRLLARGHEVHALVRRPTGRNEPRWHEHVERSEGWAEHVARLGPADVAVSCLGTTWRKAGSQAAFRAVDHHAVLAFARAAHAVGVRRFLSVSSVGADAGSRNFYLRTKGETDAALAAIGFERLDVFRPGLLLGHRGGDRRSGERAAIALDPFTRLFLRGSLSRYAGIRADTVAAAITVAAECQERGILIHENARISRLADNNC